MEKPKCFGSSKREDRKGKRINDCQCCFFAKSCLRAYRNGNIVISLIGDNIYKKEEKKFGYRILYKNW